ncbi:MAG: phosphatidylserine/phosphatidylglycerophosphate/cardiolipin synthase family protein [Alphaproteobacteria bacterium]|nr:phosphatidylserine/phosphatidylglycerophosphate/cardiolipin synthase family protein [Alphaproteobacteria bacterium]
MKRALRWIVGLALLGAGLGSVDFFFNPLGLGPEPPELLGEAFFAAPSPGLSEAELLVDGERAFETVDQLLASAQRSIYVQTYIWKDDETGKAVVRRLREAAARGVEVVVRKDMLGTVFEVGDLFAGRPSPVFTEAGLAGVPKVRVTSSVFNDADHSKYFIVDGRELVFGGMNIADEYHHDWHDYMVRFSGEARVGGFARRVLEDAPGGPGPERVAANDRGVNEVRRGHVELIDHAARRVVVEHAYISDEPVVAALERAAARGVQVDIVIPAEPDTHGAANKVTLNRLMADEDVRVLLFPEMSHAKLILVDDTFIGLGSANLTLRSMATSREVTWFAHAPADAPLLQALRTQTEADILRCERRTEPFALSLTERLMAPVDRVLW